MNEKNKANRQNLLHSPILIFLNCVAEKASRPFDLPYITARYPRPPSVVTCRVSDLMAAMASMPEVTSEDSISRRGSAVSLPRSHSNNIHGSRPNSHTQHAAAIAAAHNASTSGATTSPGGHLGGPRAPPSSLKESSASYSSNRFDDRTKRQLADSVSEASQTSEARVRIGGPRPLAASDIAVKTGVLPPPVCTEPKEVPQYLQQPQQQQQQHMQQQYQPPQQQPYHPQYSTDPEKTGSETGGGGGSWAKDWWALRTVAGWVSPAGSGATTPVSTPGVGPSPGPMGSNSRSRAARLSTVAEDWVSTGGVGGGGSGNGNGPYSPPTRPPLTRGSRDNGYHNVHDVSTAATPSPPPGVGHAGARPVRAPTAARVRLVRAQEALKSQARAKSGATVVLTRPVHLTGDRREDRSSPTRPPLQSTLSIPGSYVD